MTPLGFNFFKAFLNSRVARTRLIATLVTATFSAGSGLIFAQTTPVSLRSGIVIEPISQASGTPVRIAHDPTTDDLYYLTLSGDIYRIRAPYGSQAAQKVYTSSHHGISNNVLGFTISADGTMYVVGSRPQGAMNVGAIARGKPSGRLGRDWSTVAETEPYPSSGTQFDHNFNGIVISPDGTELFVNSGSRSDHGEIQSNGGQFPDLREIPLTSAIFRIPADGTNLILPAEQDELMAQGYLYADGVRNSFDLAFDAAGNLFATENSGDRSDTEELNWIQEGRHYGFPWRLGMNDTPQQFAGYDPDQDLLLPPTAYAVVNGFFYNDPTYPTPPDGVVFTEPIRNMGPDADKYQDEATGEIHSGVDKGIVIGSFTPHRSPLGLIFDVDDALPGDFKGKAFVLSWTAPDDHLLSPFGNEGNDMLLLQLQQNGDYFETTAERIIQNFNNPIDAVQIGDELYVLDFGGNKQIWRVSFSGGVAVEEAEIPDHIYAVDIYPNPAVDAVTFSVHVSEPQAISAEIYNTLGQRIAVVFSDFLPPSQSHDFTWSSSEWPAGAYFVRFSGNLGSLTTTFILAR